jgi:hypothetical protein
MACVTGKLAASVDSDLEMFQSFRGSLFTGQFPNEFFGPDDYRLLLVTTHYAHPIASKPSTTICASAKATHHSSNLPRDSRIRYFP